MIKIVLADNQDLTRIALNHIISGCDGMDLVQVVKNEEELFALDASEINLLIIDYNQQESFTIKTIKAFKDRYNDLPIMVISADERKDSIQEVSRLGVNCFVTKDCSEEEITEGIIASSKNERLFCQSILDVVGDGNFDESESCDSNKLSKRELEIVSMTVEGKTAKQIADILFLSHHTVSTHRKNIMRKLNLKSAQELTLFAFNAGIVKS